MTNQEQQKKMAEKNFRFNRFLFLRYVLAVFFFANLYWLLAAMASNALLLILPLALLVLAISAIGEYVRLWQPLRANSRKTAVDALVLSLSTDDESPFMRRLFLLSSVFIRFSFS